MIDMIGWLDDGMWLDGLKDVWCLMILGEQKAFPKLISNRPGIFMQSRDFIWKAFHPFPANKNVHPAQLDRLVLNRPQIRQTPQFQNWHKTTQTASCSTIINQNTKVFWGCFSERKSQNVPFVCVCVISFFQNMLFFFVCVFFKSTWFRA